MKKYLLLLSLLTLGTQAFGQKKRETLTTFNQSRQKITKTGMLVLGSWATGNLAVNGLLMPGASDNKNDRYYFYQMNVFWNLVNLGLAGLGYLNARRMSPSSLDAASSVKQYYNLQKTLLFNAGLDIGYIAGGLYLLERAKNSEENQERFRGYGRAVILQGAFLLAFDVALYALLNSKSGKLLPLLSVSANGIGLKYRF